MTEVDRRCRGCGYVRQPGARRKVAHISISPERADDTDNETTEDTAFYGKQFA